MDLDLGKKLIQQKNYRKALSFFLKEIDSGKKNIKLYFFLGFVCFRLNLIKKSIVYFKLALKIDPKSIEIILNLANSNYVIGNFLTAKSLYLKVIKLNQFDVRAYYGLYLLNLNNLNSDHISCLKQFHERKLSNYESYIVEFLLSKIAKQNQNNDLELNHLNNFHKQCFISRKEFNEQGLFYYNSIISDYYNKIGFSEENIGKNELINFNPIFIIGLPRSGSTLIETCICSSNSKIVSLGETSIINTAIIDQIKNDVFKENFQIENFKFNLNQDKLINKVFESYRDFNFTEDDNMFFVDKSLENFFNIEVILKIFPKAKFIHSKRNCKDSAISIYQSMLNELPWTHSMKDILNYINNYLKIINFFETKYSDKILSIDLEKLTHNQEFYTKKIFSFCKLEWTSDILKFYEKKNLVVKTLSNTQLRNKIQIYNKKKYAPYEKLLYDFKDKYSWLN